MRAIIAGASLLLLLCGAAQARPRDEVMINAYRCAVQAQTRVWLDCYYGAAQPQRAALGLPAAPPAQVRLLDAPPTSGTPQDVATRDAAMAAAGRCAIEAEDRPWLDCYYAAANPVRALLGLGVTASAGLPLPPPPPRPPVQGRSKPGFVGRMLGTPDLKVTSRMASYQTGGRFTVTLENGQVWQQVEGDAVARWRREPSTYQVTITGGVFGTYNLSVKDTPGFYKVRRIS